MKNFNKIFDELKFSFNINISDVGEKETISIDDLQYIETISYYRPLTSSMPFFKRPIVFSKRVIRKLIKFLIEPIVDEANKGNIAIKDLLKRQIAINNDLRKENKAIKELFEKQIEINKNLYAEIENNKGNNVEVSTKNELEKLSKRIEMLEDKSLSANKHTKVSY